ncbi:MAG TPA: bifunctional riboflavin kinase/FAD synthetase [Gemmatimonas sp.]|nr:bifunctional riboflavin kinase/FAD synthetase [Gemmatimonas sp.]
MSARPSDLVPHDSQYSLPVGDTGAVLTVGTFDGMHRGHQDVLHRVVSRGLATSRPSVVVTFDPHPLEVIKPESAPRLLTMHREKLELFAACGVSYVVVLPFTRSLAAYEADAFVDVVLRARYGMRELLVGHDHGFGRGRMGDIDTLRALGASRGFGVTVLDPVHDADGDPISSTLIRQAVAAGNVDAAAAGLGRPYSISGRVVGGDRRGRMLGFPTINLSEQDPRKLLPLDGVYAVRVQTPTGSFGGMVNLGGRPTFGAEERRIEAHLFDAEGDWYGATVRIDFVRRLRDTRRFAGPDALRAQLLCDELAARAGLGS